jgi:hypothetical protein
MADVRMLAKRVGVTDPKLQAKTSEYVRIATARLSGGGLGQVAWLTHTKPEEQEAHLESLVSETRARFAAGGAVQDCCLHGAGQHDVSRVLKAGCVPRSAPGKKRVLLVNAVCLWLVAGSASRWTPSSC